jgi:uncharacterized membrane protein YhhN
MSLGLFILALLLAAADWVAVYKHWRKIEIFLKPTVMVVLLLAVFAAQPALPGRLAFFAAGIVFSLLGDALLLSARGFMAGLVMFALAHISYIIGFNIPLPRLDLFIVLLAIFVAMLAGRLYRRINEGLHQKGLHRLQRAIQVYLVLLSLMFISGFSTLFRVEWPAAAALLVAGGATLFIASDTMLAWNKFVRPLRTRRVGYMIAYHLGQIAIIAGAVLMG